MASFASSATTGGARKLAWTNNILYQPQEDSPPSKETKNVCYVERRFIENQHSTLAVAEKQCMEKTSTEAK